LPYGFHVSSFDIECWWHCIFFIINGRDLGREKRHVAKYPSIETNLRHISVFVALDAITFGETVLYVTLEINKRICDIGQDATFIHLFTLLSDVIMTWYYRYRMLLRTCIYHVPCNIHPVHRQSTLLRSKR
jgi:hypothetical protein